MGIKTVPPRVDIVSTETVGIEVDMTNAIVVGESVTSPTCVLTDESDNTAYAAGLSGGATVSGNKITQKVTALTKGKRYRLSFSFVAAAGITKSRVLIIEVPY